MSVRWTALGLALALALALPAGALAQAPAPPNAAQVPAPPNAAQAAPPSGQAPPGPDAAFPATGPARKIDDPYDAYDAGVYDQALQKFVDAQIERPDDPALMMNIGASHFQMRNYEEAQKSFSAAALRGDDRIRERALYNLGNVAYRQGKLEDAIAQYQAALDIDPNDEDAKFNLEFVRDEIRRRHEEAQKRQEEQQQQEQQQQQQPSDSQGEQQPSDGNEQQQGQSGEGKQNDEPDADADGLGDQRERDAKNPTDPKNPDTDGDGLPDGREDENRNGVVDAGETDPNKPDTDGDGVADAAEAQPQQDGKEQQAAAAEADGGAPGEMTPEQAERYLQALQEGRPQERKPQKGRSDSRPAKDW